MKFMKRFTSLFLATAITLGVPAGLLPSSLHNSEIVVQAVEAAGSHITTTLPTPDAEGQGGGPTEGLMFYNDRFSTIRPGDTNVPTNAMLLFAFNKNVATIRPDYSEDSPMAAVNFDKIDLFENGSKINGLYVKNVSQAMIDEAKYDYTEGNYRNYLYLPATLKANTNYKVIISPDLKAANGQTIGQLFPEGIDFEFTTGN